MVSGPLSIGLRGRLHIREEHIATRPDACRLMYVSDIHLRPGRSEGLSRQVIDAARGAAIHLLLLGGDLVDRATELMPLRDLVAALCEIAPVMAVGGNHDFRVGLARVQDAITAGGGVWIHAGGARHRHGSRTIAVSGPEAAWPLVGDVQILCAHNPRVWKAARRRGFDLVLAGHLHGCQFVAFEYRSRLFPGAMFYPCCFLNHRHGAARLVVSRGVSDLVPIRWRCPREVVLCCV